jgi:hypothetical protein
MITYVGSKEVDSKESESRMESAEAERIKWRER